MLFTSVAEPYISGRQFGLQSITLGALIGGITFLLSVLYVAYSETKKYNLKLRAESAEISLNVLKSQLHPHFLFNSLNSLSELIETHQYLATTMAQQLSDLYREILINSKSQFTSLESELSLIEKYLALEKIRFGDRLNYSITAPNINRTIYLPSLILQTLVENSIKHRISKSIEGGTLEIIVCPTSVGYKITLIDTGKIELPKSKEGSTGIGLENTKERLSLIYGDKHSLNLNFTENKSEISFLITGNNESAL